MNKIVLMGRIIKDPELRILEESEKMVTKFIIAVERNFKGSDGTRKSDLIPVVMWGRKAEVLCQYGKKGTLLSLSGRLRTGSYEDKEGNKKYIAEVIAEDFKFIQSKTTEEKECIDENK
ncbi:MAG: single-stranded DNA-binding protein [Clostridiaceae bacterium]